MNSYGPHDFLTKTQTAVLRLVDRGLSNGEIATRLLIGVGTVKWHLHQAYEKLQAHSRIDAVVKARAQGVFGEAGADAGSTFET